MDFRFSPEDEAFRQEVKAWLKKELTPEIIREAEENSPFGWAFSLTFSRKLGKRGWIGITWPREYGGLNKPLLQDVILQEELSYHGAPIFAYAFGQHFVGPTILRFGNEEQKKKYIGEITSGDLVWCEGFSEPDAGSDLASLRCRAERIGGDYVINGEKIWTSNAHRAQYCLLGARTDPTVTKHRGITMFAVDMKTPGIIVDRHLPEMSGAHRLNHVVFDNVRVPKEALIGEENRGWYQMALTLDYERVGFGRAGGFKRLLEQIAAHVKQTGWNRSPAESAILRHKLAEIAIEVAVCRVLQLWVASMLNQGVVPTYESAMAKLFGDELEQRLANLGMEILGLKSQLLPGSKWAVLEGRMQNAYMTSIASTIQAGTAEICRNIVALRGLQLPRE
jgi:alkylation response protein AidB-like acyl-CoA dehydrogenase